jgi:carbon-monoxide dehydrogenase medium subunit
MSFALHEPTSLGDAIALGARFGAEGRFIAGGTDIVIQMNRKRLAPREVVSLSRLPDLSGIELSPSGYSIGALTTHKTIERFPAFRNRIGMLGAASQVIGGHQVRNIATIGGNVVNASPAADAVVPLLVLDAEVDLAGAAGKRTLPLGRFLRGPGQTDRSPDEVLTHIRFKHLPPNSGTAFLKAGRRKAMEISIVCVAARLTLDPDARITGAAIGLGAVGATALRCPQTEALLTGRQVRLQLFAEASRCAANECTPISDVRASANYRGMMVATLVGRALERCVEALKEFSR